MSTEDGTFTYGINDAYLYFSCPEDVDEDGQWKTEPWDKHGTEVKGASGIGCTAQLIIDGTSASIFGGYIKQDGMAWGCSDNLGATYDKQSRDGDKNNFDFDFFDLPALFPSPRCSFPVADKEGSQSKAPYQRASSTSASSSSSVATTQSASFSSALSTSLSPSSSSTASSSSLGSNTVVFASIIGVVLAIVILCLFVALVRVEQRE
ncbi:hypothetical protein JCM10207_002659 [Rhodosporidiobolus poonsookiae]